MGSEAHVQGIRGNLRVRWMYLAARNGSSTQVSEWAGRAWQAWTQVWMQAA